MATKVVFSLLPLLNRFDKSLLESYFQDGLRLIHYDVMDQFVHNTAFKGEYLDELKTIGFDVNVHLMVEQIIPQINFYLSQPNVKRISFHVEPFSFAKIKELIQLVKENGKEVGLAFKFTTNLQLYQPFFTAIDFITLMSVPPGKGGQAFNEAVFTNLKIANHYNLKIEIDGGIKVDNIDQIKAFVDFIVMGSGFIKLEQWQRQKLLQTI
ncbi:ribulose-phosphate 3-epimerase [Mycoplasmoides genitalium]